MKISMLKQIPEYEGRYSINEDGEIYSHLTNRFLNPAKVKDGSLKVGLKKNGKNKAMMVHSIMKNVFLKAGREMVVEFIDGNKSNCKLSNLKLKSKKDLCIEQSKNAVKTRRSKKSGKICEGKLCEKELFGFQRKYCEKCAKKNYNQKIYDLKLSRKKMLAPCCEICGYVFFTRDSRRKRCEYHLRAVWKQEPKEKKIIEKKTERKKTRKIKQTIEKQKTKEKSKSKLNNCTCIYCGIKFEYKKDNATCCKKEECKIARNKEYNERRKEKRGEEKKEKEHEIISRDMTKEEEDMVEKFLKENGGSKFDKD